MKKYKRKPTIGKRLVPKRSGIRKRRNKRRRKTKS